MLVFQGVKINLFDVVWINLYSLDQPLRLQTPAIHTYHDWLLIAFIAMAAIQLIYYWVVYSRFAFAGLPSFPQTDIPVSVVLSAKNEYHGLKNNLPLILEQDRFDGLPVGEREEVLLCAVCGSLLF